MNELGVQKEVRTQIVSPFWLRRVNYGSQYLRLVRLLLSNICIPDKNIGFVGNKRLSLFSMPRGQNEVMWRSKSAGVYPRLVSEASLLTVQSPVFLVSSSVCPFFSPQHDCTSH